MAQVSIVASSNDILQSNTFAIDSKGNLYINDVQNNVIRKISADRSSSVLASEIPCLHLAIDKSDNLIAVPWNGVVHKITPNGTVSSIGSIQGPSYGAAVDASGNIFISLSATIQNTGLNENKILKMTPSGVTSVFAGNDQPGYVDGNAQSARFNNPQGLAFDSSGNLYVVDAGNSVIRKIDPQGNVSTYAGSSENAVHDGSLRTAAFQFRAYGSQPEALAISKDGDIFVGEKYGIGLLRYIGANGSIGTYCGNGQSDSRVKPGPCSQSPFYQTGRLAIGNDGFIYFNDGYGDIARIKINRSIITRHTPDSNTPPADKTDTPTLIVPAVSPTSIVVDGNSVYWGDSVSWGILDSSIRKVPINSSASLATGLMTYGPVTTLASNIAYTFSLAMDSNQIYWIDNGQSYRVSINGGASTPLAYGYTTNIAVDQNGLYYGFNPTGLKKIDKVSGVATILAPPDSTSFAYPYALAVSAGFAYWNDSASGNIKKVSTNGGSVTILTTAGPVSSMAIDSSNLYWSDRQGIHSISINGGTASLLASESSSLASCLQVDSQYVYWATDTDIKKVPLGGGNVTSLVHPPSDVISRAFNGSLTSNCLAVNSDYVFFGKNGGLYRIAK